MQIGLSTAAYYGRLETEEAAAKVAALGLPCCEVFLETFSEYSPQFGALVKANLGDTRAVSIHAKTQHFESDIYGQSPRQRADAFGLMERFLDAGKVLGAHVYVYHGPARIRGGRPGFGAWDEGITRAMAMARARGIDLSWEVVSWCHLRMPELVGAFRKQWPDLHYVLDIKQVHEMGQDPMDYIRAMGDRLRHVHVLDFAANGRLVLPGQGVFDFRAFARALRDNGYTGDVILEPYADVIPNDAALMESIAYLRDVFGAE